MNCFCINSIVFVTSDDCFLLVGRNVSLFVVLGFLFNICPGTVLPNSLLYFSGFKKCITDTCRRPKNYVRKNDPGVGDFHQPLQVLTLYMYMYSVKRTMEH